MQPACTLNMVIGRENVTIPVFDALVTIIGSGAAALNAAIHLVENGIPPGKVVMVTDCWGGGTSYNAGSDKQTYYKLSISGKGNDSPLIMAKDLHDGGAMHGDIALVEAATSIEEFFHLIRLGMKFPKNEYGVYPGYRTDNDERERATSAGPYTSREMVTCLANAVAERGIPVLDRHLAIQLLHSRHAGRAAVHGVACIDIDGDAVDANTHLKLKVVRSPNVFLATGGPANIYEHSVYPVQHFCGHGLGISAGAKLQNLPFMQYGIASKKFRWNLSGSFQQVIPTYLVENARTGERKELLHGVFPDPVDSAYQTFLKGYNWPFDPSKTDPNKANRSSMVDLAVHDAVVNKGERVLIDFKTNPWETIGKAIGLQDLPPDAFGFLDASGTLQATPIERLRHLNPLAIDVFKDQDIYLEKEAIEICVATQHCNGGLVADINWESINVEGLYPVGEVNGSHGHHRPGGAALNAGQVGGYRAARHVANTRRESPPLPAIKEIVEASLGPVLERVHGRIERGQSGTGMNGAWHRIRTTMSGAAGIERSAQGLKEAIVQVTKIGDWLDSEASLKTIAEVIDWFRCKDAMITSKVILDAMHEQVRHEPGVHPCYINKDTSRVQSGGVNQALVTWLDGREIKHGWDITRPIPDIEDVFEDLLKNM